MASCLPAGDSTEHRPNGESESGEVTFPEYVPGHNFSRRKNVSRRPLVLQDNARLLVHGDAQISKGYTGSQWVAVERRRVDRPRPVALRWRETVGTTVVQRTG